jgi:peptide deformylase
MTKDNIITLPNPHLRQPSRKVGKITKKILTIIDNMEKATLSWDQSRDHEVGVALAAVQIDELNQIVIIRNNLEDKDDLSFKAYINPKITKLYGDIIEDYEGCLSIPDIYGKVPRYSKIKLSALDINGQQIQETINDFRARIFQHEIDHNNGILFIDHIKERTDAFYILDKKGKIKQLNYEEFIKNNSLLW